MLPESKLKTFRELIDTSSQDELIWMSGFLTGILVPGRDALTTRTLDLPTKTKKITIAYGTETGNAKKLAVNFAGISKQSGIAVKLTALDQIRLEEFSKEEYFFLIVSTQGEGEPPEQALKFFNYIHSENLNLEKLNYSVLALGDTSYPLFCKAGEDIDNRLTFLGANQFVPIQKCDVDYSTEAANWFQLILSKLKEKPVEQVNSEVKPVKSTGKKNYIGTVISSVNLNDSGSNKETYHIEIAVDEQVDYLPGDAIGVLPQNDLNLVEIHSTTMLLMI
jgi:sulfite reductase (NADPH) flavoprotein alpha-component